MTILRIFVAILSLALAGAIVWATLNTGGNSLHGDFWQQGGAIMTLPWGLVAMIDLYVGFSFFAILMVLAERSFIAGLLWAAPIFVLGNVWAAIWLLIRLPGLAQRLTRPDWPS